MKFEDIKDQAALDTMIAEAVNSAVAGLKAKNEEILGKLASNKDNLIPAGVDLVALQKASDDLKALKDKDLESQGEYKKLLDTSRTQHAEEMQKQIDALTSANSEIKHLMVNQGLSTALSASNINPVLLDAAISLLSGDVTLTEQDGKRIAQVGDKSLVDYVKDWTASDVGKNFTLAPANGGGGAGGNAANGNGQDENAKFWTHEGWNKTEQAKVYGKDQDLYEKMTAAHPTQPAAPAKSA